MFKIKTCKMSSHTTWGKCFGKKCEGAKYHYFSVYDAQGRPSGSLRKVWSGCYRECCSGADYYDYSYPNGANADVKAVFLAAI